MKLTMAEAQAVGLCVLARSGLPAIHNLRASVGTMHVYACGWCEPVVDPDEPDAPLRPAYPVDVLVGWLRDFNLTRTRFEDERWSALPPRVKGEAIRAAQGEAAA